jgi:hypothetical protein
MDAPGHDRSSSCTVGPASSPGQTAKTLSDLPIKEIGSNEEAVVVEISYEAIEDYGHAANQN